LIVFSVVSGVIVNTLPSQAPKLDASIVSSTPSVVVIVVLSKVNNSVSASGNFASAANTGSTKFFNSPKDAFALSVVLVNVVSSET
jgi:hypothetical protein